MEFEQTSPELITPRLKLRRWRQSDLEPFADLNADSRVMEYYPKLLSREESDASVQRMEEHFDRHGFGFWAVEIIGVTPFIGFTGLNIPSYETPFTPCVEVGWKLAFPFWGNGYATEAARTALQFGFKNKRLSEIVAFTVPSNFRSRAIMRKLKMRHCTEEDFDHPLVNEGHPLRHHVLYRINGE